MQYFCCWSYHHGTAHYIYIYVFFLFAPAACGTGPWCLTISPSSLVRLICMRGWWTEHGSQSTGLSCQTRWSWLHFTLIQTSLCCASGTLWHPASASSRSACQRYQNMTRGQPATWLDGVALIGWRVSSERGGVLKECFRNILLKLMQTWKKWTWNE